MAIVFDPLLGRMRTQDVPSGPGSAAADITLADAGGFYVATNVEAALAEIGGTYVTTYWFESIASGTSGTLTPPAGSTIILDWGEDAADCLVSAVGTDGRPDWTTPLTAAGVAVTATLDSGGNWALSGTPATYPVALVFRYRIPITRFDYTKALDETTLTVVADAAAWTAGGNDDVDTGTEVVDEVTIDETCAVAWLAWISKPASRVMRTMWVTACLLKTDDGYGGYNYDADFTVYGTPDIDPNATAAIPTTVFSVAFDEGTTSLQLKATVDSDNWATGAKRMEVVAV